MNKCLFILLVIPILVFSQRKETYITEKGFFCSIEIMNNDTIWEFGEIHSGPKSTDSLSMNFLIKYEPLTNLHFGNLKSHKVSCKDFEFEVTTVDNNYYQKKFGVLSSRFVFLLLENGDNFIRKSKDYTRDSVAHWYNCVYYFLSLVKNDSLQFLIDQLSHLKSDNDFSSIAKKCFEEKDYESALFYSKLFLIKNDIKSESDLEVAMIFDLSNVAFELNNRYALLTSENEILRNLIYRSADFFPETWRFQIVE